MSTSNQVTDGVCLNNLSTGAADGPPIVFLHGFGGDRHSWDAVRDALPISRNTIAFDLPGFAGSLHWPKFGHIGLAARAVETSLDALDIEQAHLVGHSMGGSTSVLTAMNCPGRIRSLTLLAPGGFGHEINHRLLRRYAAAETRTEIEVLLEQFFGWRNGVPDGLAEKYAHQRQDPLVMQALQTIISAILNEDSQGTLPRDRLAHLGCPVKVLWGTQDRVVPTRQAHKLDGLISTHIFEEVGHMLAEEIPVEAARLIAENVLAGDQIAHPIADG